MGHRRAFCSSFERTITAIKMCSSLKKLIYDCKTKQGQINTHIHTNKKTLSRLTIFQKSRQILPGGGFKWQKYVKHNLSLHAHIFFVHQVCVCVYSLCELIILQMMMMMKIMMKNVATCALYLFDQPTV